MIIMKFPKSERREQTPVTKMLKGSVQSVREQRGSSGNINWLLYCISESNSAALLVKDALFWIQMVMCLLQIYSIMETACDNTCQSMKDELMHCL